MKAPIRRVLVLASAIRTHGEISHGRQWPIIGDVACDGEAWPAVGAVGERVPKAAVGRVEHLDFAAGQADDARVFQRSQQLVGGRPGRARELGEVFLGLFKFHEVFAGGLLQVLDEELGHALGRGKEPLRTAGREGRDPVHRRGVRRERGHEVESALGRAGEDRRDHLGLGGIKTVEELAYVKRLVLEVVRFELNIFDI